MPQPSPQPIVTASPIEPAILPRQEVMPLEEREPLTIHEEEPTQLRDREIRELFVQLRQTVAGASVDQEGTMRPKE